MATALVGKWHLGLASPNLPNERGFDVFRGFLGDMMDSYTTHLRHGQNCRRHDERKIQAEGHAIELFTDWTCEFIRSAAAPPNRPFFISPTRLYLAYTAFHFPIEPPDDCFGRVLAALDEAGLAARTLIVVTSDNGSSLPHAQRNLPWRGGKQDYYDGGLWVPFVVRWPGVAAVGATSDYAELTFDIAPTFLEVAGLPAPAEMGAVSLAPILGGEPMPDGERELYFVRREGGPRYGGKSHEALIRGGWKLMQNAPTSPWELYNQVADPLEQTNWCAAEPKRAPAIWSAWRRHIQRSGATP